MTVKNTAELLNTVERIVTNARADGRSALLESEGLELLSAMGISLPHYAFIEDIATIDRSNFAAFMGPARRASREHQVVIKIVAANVLHKSELGGVRHCDASVECVIDTIRSMQRELRDVDVRGFLIVECVDHEPGVSGEFLLGARSNAEFGPVVVFGPGGVHTEVLSSYLQEGCGMGIVSAVSVPDDGIGAALRDTLPGILLTRPLRGQPAQLQEDTLVDAVERFRTFAARFMPDPIQAIEINPAVARDGKLLALDVMVELTPEGTEPTVAATPRPLTKMRHLFEPRSVAVVGVSTRMNPGHVIINNLIKEGFEPQNIYIVKPEVDSIEGCACYPDIASLPQRVDLLVLSIAAAQVPAALAETIEHEKAESVIVIPGGLEEKAGSGDIVTRVQAALAASRDTPWRGPVITGGNSLGVRSRPGRVDTQFIPDYKLGVLPADEAPLAFISQSGAFGIARSSKLRRIRPRYMISIGNQMDLTFGDYLDHLKSDGDIETFAIYAEGFKACDGLKFIEAARQITCGGRNVLLYRAGRTSAGARASASHTASIAGDYAVTRELARNAGVVVADTIEDFEDLLMLFCMLRGRPLGRRIAAVSNAGFESVAMADRLDGLELAQLSSGTTGALGVILEQARLDQVVDVNNPLDLTPIMSDRGFQAALRTVIDDDGVDVGIFGCVPLTPALNTLPAGEYHDEDFMREGSFARRLVSLFHSRQKPFVSVIDAGPAYDALAAWLLEQGLPTFRTADRALRALSTFIAARPSA